jgi:cytochrome c oxidase subunit 2
LDSAGSGAAQTAELFWIMMIGAAVIWVLVIGIAIYAVRGRAHGPRAGQTLIIGGGVIVPVIVLAALLTKGLAMMPGMRPAEGGLRVEVVGEQFWWRVRYWPPGATTPIESANEVRLPLGERTELTLVANDVIHSFWVPSIAGKRDMIPGRVNRLVIEPTETGTFRGQCAEFCGASHALMALAAVVMEADAFARWLDAEAIPASPTPAAAEGEGLTLFLMYGCGACHTIRGTPARGVVGPDLTHVGGRQTIGAGILPTNASALANWIANPETIKPGARMPPFGMAPERDIAAIARYLESLK